MFPQRRGGPPTVSTTGPVWLPPTARRAATLP
jgi:hypothetical protein